MTNETSRRYDPMDYETWPEEQKDFAGRVWRALHDGDLMPLAAYLRAGHYIEPALAREIADAIEGSEDCGRYRIKAVGRRRGERGMSDSFERHDRKMAIGFFVEDLIRERGRGSWRGAVDDAMVKFGAKEATVTAAHKYLKDHVSRSKAAPGWDIFEGLRPFYSTD